MLDVGKLPKFVVVGQVQLGPVIPQGFRAEFAHWDCNGMFVTVHITCRHSAPTSQSRCRGEVNL